LIAAAKAQGVTLFSVAAASLAVALQKATGSSNTARVAIGTQMSVRDQQELEGVIGPLINTVILRLDIAPDSTLASVIAQCGAKLSDAIEHLHVPFEEMREMAGEAASTDRPPLCSVNFALQQSFVGMGDEVRRDAFAATTSPSFNAGALYDLNFFMVRRPEGWRISCEGDLDLYDMATDAHLATWRDVLQNVEITAPAAQKAAPVHSQVQAQTQAQIAAGVGNSAFISRPRWMRRCKRRALQRDGTQTPIIVLNNVAVFYELAQQVGAQRAIVDMPMVPKTPQHFPPRAFSETLPTCRAPHHAFSPKARTSEGYCVLSAMALEAAHQMRREGDTVELVILNDPWRPGHRESMPWYDKILRRFRSAATTFRATSARRGAAKCR
jgi:hypothetical protein